MPLLRISRSAYLKSVLRYTFVVLDPIIRTLHIWVRKDVRIRDYFSKPKGVYQQKRLGNTALCVQVVQKYSYRVLAVSRSVYTGTETTSGSNCTDHSPCGQHVRGIVIRIPGKRFISSLKLSRDSRERPAPSQQIACKQSYRGRGMKLATHGVVNPLDTELNPIC